MKTTRTCCTRHCGNGCALLVTERDDGSIKITGDPEHPFTKGFICSKTAKFMDRLGATDRILEPMIKENGEFRKVDWNEALELVARKINALRPTPERMMNIFYVASYGILFRASPAFFGRLGCSEVSGDYCQNGGHEAQMLDFGLVKQPMLVELNDSKRLVNWGRNLDAQAMLLGREVNKQRERGMRVLTIVPGDPGYEKYSDDMIVIRPGTDRFLALAVVKILMERGADMSFARDRVFNWMEFEALQGLQKMDMLLESCGVSQKEAQLVADYYQDGSTATVIGRGLQRYTYGGENVRFIDALAVCAGWVGMKGGGVYYSQGDLGNIRFDWYDRPAPAPRQLPFHSLGRAIMQADPPIEFIYIDGTNALNQVPDAPALVKACQSPNTFVVAVEAFMNDTALNADVILPPALLFETEDLVRCSSHGFVHHSTQVFEPRGKTRSNFEIIADLASRLDPPLPFPTAEQIMSEALKAKRMTTKLEHIRKQSYVPSPAYAPPFEQGIFAHSDGLARLVTQLHVEPEATKGYPLRLLSFVQKKHMLSQIPEAEQQGLQTLWLAPKNALLLANGGSLDLTQRCYLATEMGRMEVKVKTLDSLHPQAAYICRGGWLKTGWGLNRLIGPHEADLGGQCAYYAQWCSVEN